jgi:hypothetical protein
MAKWMARKVGLLGTRLEVTQVPEEGRSVHEPVWSKVNLETLLDMVEHLNSKNETIKCLFEEIRKLKVSNERLAKQAYGRPRELANGGMVHPRPVNAMVGIVEDYGINPVPAVLATINAPDAVNGEIPENVRRAAAMDFEDRPIDTTSTDSSSYVYPSTTPSD